MGLVVGRVQPVNGFESVMNLDVKKVRELFEHFEDVCPTPTLWERAFYELLDCFENQEVCSKAFAILDNDNDGFVDARECFGALAVLSKGHLRDRLNLLFDIFDLNKENDMGFDEAFLMLWRTSNGLRKITGLVAPPEQVIHIMVEQIWKQAKKHIDIRIAPADWEAWWARDATCRAVLKAFVLRPEDQRGLPTPDTWRNVDYAKDAGVPVDAEASSASLLAPPRIITGKTRTPSGHNLEALEGAMDPDKVVVPKTAPVVDYEELVREGQTRSPFLQTPEELEQLLARASSPKVMPVA